MGIRRGRRASTWRSPDCRMFPTEESADDRFVEQRRGRTGRFRPRRGSMETAEAAAPGKRRRRLFSLVCLVPAVLALTCAALLQYAKAQMVSISPAAHFGSEGRVFRFEVRLGAAAAEDVTVRWTLTGTDPEKGDYSATLSGPDSDFARDQALTGTVVFRAGDTAAKRVGIATRDDARVEGSETFTVTLSEDAATALPDEVDISDTADAGTGTITEDDTATLSIRDAGAAEGSWLRFRVGLSAPSQQPVTVRWTATAIRAPPGSGLSGLATLSDPGSDLATGQALAGTVEFAANDATKTVSIATADDARVEGAEIFDVTLSEDTEGGNPLPPGVFIGDRGVFLGKKGDVAAGTITDDDTATLSIGDAEAVEGAPIEFVVNLSAPVSELFFVDAIVTSAGGAGAVSLPGDTPLADYDLRPNVAAGATLRFLPGEVARTFDVQTLEDDRVEGDETFTVTLSESSVRLAPTGLPLPEGVSISPTAGAATGTITEDDDAVISIETSARAAEGSPVAFDVSLSAASPQPVTVRWTVTPFATDFDAATLLGPNSDLAAGQALTGTVAFAANDTADKTVSIATGDDTLVERNEIFFVTLSATLSNGVRFGNRTAEGRIENNDGALGFLGERSVLGLFGGSGVNPYIYGQEGEEVTLRVSYTSLPGPATLAWTATPFSTDGRTPADVDADLEMSSGTVTIDSSGTGRATFPIAITDDEDSESPEHVLVTLSVPAGRPLPAGVRLLDGADEQILVIQGDPDDGDTLDEAYLGVDHFFGGIIRETTSPASLGQNLPTIRLSPDGYTGPDVMFSYSTYDGTATGGEDFVAFDEQDTLPLTRNLTIRDLPLVLGERGGQDARYFLEIMDDTILEGDETFTVTHTVIAPGVEFETGGRTEISTYTIQDDDFAIVSLNPSATAVEDAGSITFTVTLDNPVAEAFSLAWTATDGTATVRDDLGRRSGTVRIAALSRRAAFSIPISNDMRVEGSETFTVMLSGTPTGLVAVNPDRITIDPDNNIATGTITDDETASVSISDATASEGSAIAFEVALSAAWPEAVTVRWTATTAGGAGAAVLEGAGSDLAGGEVLTGTVVFAADDSAAKTISLATANDALVEGRETFTVTLSEDTRNNNPLPTGVTIPAATATATGTITEDETAVLSIGDAEGTEGSAVAFEIALSAASSEPVTARWTVTGDRRRRGDARG